MFYVEVEETRLFWSGGGVAYRHFVVWEVQNERDAYLNTSPVQCLNYKGKCVKSLFSKRISGKSGVSMTRAFSFFQLKAVNRSTQCQNSDELIWHLENV